MHKASGDEIHHICYQSPITRDVIGHLDGDSLMKLVQKVSELPENLVCTHKWR